MPYKTGEDILAYRKKWYQRNKLRLKAIRDTPDIKLKNKLKRDTPQMKLKRKLKRDIYQKSDHYKKYRKVYMRNNKQYQRGHQLRKKLRLAIIHQKAYLSTIHKLIGCDIPTARAFLENQFDDWMSWENYGQGKGKWCIDHIQPIGNVDLYDSEAVKRVFHYTNMQPMEWMENIIKNKS